LDRRSWYLLGLIGLLFAPLRIGGFIGGYRLEKAFSSRNHNYSAPHKNNNERSDAHP
jgi:hypothetical protein